MFMRPGDTISTRTSRTAIVILAATMFVTGFTGFVFECILSTVATYVLGNSVEQFSITIGLMLACMGLGSFAQQYVKARRPILPFVGVELLLVTIGGFAPVAMYAAFGFFEHHFQLIQYAIAGAIGFLIGSEVPFATRINEDFRGVPLPNNLASIFLWDYLGGFIGAVIFTKFLMPRVPLTEMSFLLGGVVLAIALLNYMYFMDVKRLTHYAAFALVALALGYGYSQNRRWNVALEQRLYADRIIYATTTPYQRIVLQHNDTKNEYRLTLNGGLQFSSLDEARYHEFLVHVPMAFARGRIKVLVLGGGDGLGLREILKYPNVESVTLVDLDPMMTRFAATHPVMTTLNHGSFADARVAVLRSGGVAEGSGHLVTGEELHPHARRVAPDEVAVAEVSVINIDADKFLREVQDVYDVVIVDFPDPRSIELCKLYSKEFYLKLRRVLATHGVAAIQSTSVYYSREAYLMVGRTLEDAGFSVLRYHHDVPSFGDWGWHLVWKDDRTVDQMKQDLHSLRALAVHTEYVTPELVATATDFGKGVLTTTDHHINTLMEPRLLDVYLRSWVVD
jgi:spermidine synthase